MARFPGLRGWTGTRKLKLIRILLKQETVSGSGISWAICKSAPRSRQITTPAPHHSVFYRSDAINNILPTTELFCSFRNDLKNRYHFVLACVRACYHINTGQYCIKLTVIGRRRCGARQVAFLDVVGAHHPVGECRAIELLQLLYRRVGNARREQHGAQIVDDVARVILRRPRLRVDFHCRPIDTTSLYCISTIYKHGYLWQRQAVTNCYYYLFISRVLQSP